VINVILAQPTGVQVWAAASLLVVIAKDQSSFSGKSPEIPTKAMEPTKTTAKVRSGRSETRGRETEPPTPRNERRLTFGFSFFGGYAPHPRPHPLGRPEKFRLWRKDRLS
jgi:hypothetical protein